MLRLRLQGAWHMHGVWPPEGEHERNATLQGSLRKGERAEAVPQKYERKANTLPQGAQMRANSSPTGHCGSVMRGHPVHLGGCRSWGS